MGYIARGVYVVSLTYLGWKVKTCGERNDAGEKVRSNPRQRRFLCNTQHHVNVPSKLPQYLKNGNLWCPQRFPQMYPEMEVPRSSRYRIMLRWPSSMTTIRFGVKVVG
jgi:hypothetical protein